MECGDSSPLSLSLPMARITEMLSARFPHEGNESGNQFSHSKIRKRCSALRGFHQPTPSLFPPAPSCSIHLPTSPINPRPLPSIEPRKSSPLRRRPLWPLPVRVRGSHFSWRSSRHRPLAGTSRCSSCWRGRVGRRLQPRSGSCGRSARCGQRPSLIGMSKLSG